MNVLRVAGAAASRDLIWIEPSAPSIRLRAATMCLVTLQGQRPDKIHWTELDCHWRVRGIARTTDRWPNHKRNMWRCRRWINERKGIHQGEFEEPGAACVCAPFSCLCQSARTCTCTRERVFSHTLAWSDLTSPNNREPARRGEKKKPNQFQYSTNGPHHANTINNGPFSSVNSE